MDEELIARGFWGPRQETPEQVADELSAFIAGLDEVFGEKISWSSPAMPGKSLDDRDNALKAISDAFRENTDAPNLGISQAYRGRGDRIMVAITLVVGGYTESARVRNSIVVKWRGADVAKFADRVLRQLAAAWDPDWAAVTSRSLNEALAEVQPAGKPGPKLGYLNYLSEGRAKALPGGMDKHLERLDNGGVVIGSGEGDGFLPVEKIIEFAKVLRLSAAFSPTPTDRSKL
ncbi:Imm52 family immunity protein [Nocardioides sp. NPDC047086]|uniref:Imm52 family immunity protein n=1 Tax=Nocardioides sp. NPDC047086 TaxID=3154810 RepID=UPI0034036837